MTFSKDNQTGSGSQQTASRHQPSLILAQLCVAFIALLITTYTAHAGFSAWGGTGMSFGDGTDSAENRANTRALREQLKKAENRANPFRADAGLGLSDAAAHERIKCIRENVRQMIELAKKRLSDDCADWLQEQFDNGNICVSWGMTANGTVSIDKTSTKLASEKVAISARGIVGGTLPCHDPAIVNRAGTIVHETMHAGQSYGTPAGSAREALGKKYAENEVASHGAEADWSQAMTNALCNPQLWNPGTAIPANTDPAIKCILKCLRSMTNATARTNAADRLKNGVHWEGAGDATAKACYGAAKKAFCDFIDGTLTKPELLGVLNSNQWKHYTSWLTNTAFITADLPSNIQQFTLEDGSGPTIPTGLARVMSFAVLNDSARGPVLVVSGIEFSGNGEVQLYFDEDGDRFFDVDTRQTIIDESPQLRNNLTLFQDPFGPGLFIYDSASLQLMPLIDINEDGIPDQLAPPMNEPHPLMQEFFSFEFDPSAQIPTILGFDTIDSIGPAVLFDAPVLVMRDFDRDGFFEDTQVMPWDLYLKWTPTFALGTIFPGAVELALFGMPGVELQIWSIDPSGEMLDPLGQTLGLGIPEPNLAPLFRPLFPGEQIVIMDPETGMRSAIMEVPQPQMPSLQVTRVGNHLMICWDQTPIESFLEVTSDLTSGEWEPASGSGDVVGGRNCILIPIKQGQRQFFRLTGFIGDISTTPRR